MPPKSDFIGRRAQRKNAFVLRRNLHMVFWLNGEWVPAQQAMLPCAAAGTLLGWGCFTTAGVWNGRVFALDRHLARLRRDAARLDVAVNYEDEVLEAALTSLLARNGIADGIARLTATRRGDGRWHNDDGSDLLLMALPRAAHNELLDPGGAANAEFVPTTAGLRLAISPFRIEARRALAGIKATSYGDYQMAWREAAQRGFDEAVLLNSRGALCECARANLFWMRGGELHTPALETGCLPGIAREIICEWARAAGTVLRAGFFPPQEVFAADEAFVTSAAQGPRPVAVFDAGGEIGGEGEAGLSGATSPRVFAAPGPITSRLQIRWQAAVAQVKGHR